MTKELLFDLYKDAKQSSLDNLKQGHNDQSEYYRGVADAYYAIYKSMC